MADPKEEEIRDWANLPEGLLTSIFEKTGQIHVLEGPQFVCRPWRKASTDPSLWRRIDMIETSLDKDSSKLEEMAMSAIKIAGDQLREFWAGDIVTDRVLFHLPDLASDLRCLRLIKPHYISDVGLSEVLCTLPKLEDLEITYEVAEPAREIFKLIGQACPQLKSFRYNRYGIRKKVLLRDNIEAFSIACYMPELCKLQILGNMLTNKGLHTILDKCTHLESLDLRCCFNVNFDTSILEKCSRIKDLKLPNDVLVDDFGFVPHIWDNEVVHIENDSYWFPDWVSGDIEHDAEFFGDIDYDAFLYEEVRYYDYSDHEMDDDDGYVHESDDYDYDEDEDQEENYSDG